MACACGYAATTQHIVWDFETQRARDLKAIPGAYRPASFEKWVISITAKPEHM
ncbi:hypothetical protein IscW_ISCW012929 [Ixodes scapularis]|uniref:Uncharacterized protein n=1 Tax=Ixodes scapularis TaxID=6945 RepID=B7QBJ3_IXOSC|nr:hypothetical protein IscW_ISCW012929 [Ixodes scapularis]|eukprot:XP_002412919.1 hypothetical protein IscW_ISCW012929 [Ixodes scapularis]